MRHPEPAPKRPRGKAESASMARCRAFSGLAGLVSVGIGGSSLAGWFLDSPRLMWVLPGTPGIALATAGLLVLAGASLLLMRSEPVAPVRRRLGAGLAWMVVLTSGWMVLARVFGLDIGGRQVALDQELVLLAYPQTAVALLLYGCALLALDGPSPKSVIPAEALALGAFLIPYVALLGYAFGIVLVAPSIPMAVNAAVALIFLSLGLLCARPNRGWMASFTRSSPGGLILRRFLPFIMLGPPLLGIVRLGAERIGLLTDPMGVALLVLVLTAVTMALAVWNAVTVDRLDAERRRSEAYLRQFQLLVSSVTDYAIFLLDARGRVKSWNASAEHLKGYRSDEIIGRPFRRFFSPEENRQRKPHHLLHEAAKKGSSCDEGWYVSGGGAQRWEELVVTALRDPSGCLVGFAVITRDLTDRKRAYEEVASRTAELEKAKELHQLKDHFLSTISHEMKTPLSLITGYAELLEESDEHRALVAGIQEGARRLNAHIDHILDYSALLSGSMPLYPTEINLGEIAANAKAITEGGAKLHEQKIEVEVDSQTPPLRGDSKRMTQMLVELLENAEKVTPRGGRMGVRIGPRGSEVRIDVWDTGPGISEEDFPRIWEAFSQLEAGDAFRKGGLGLGLTIVKKLAELHGGKVAVVSQLGKGTTFSVTLPASGLPAAGASSKLDSLSEATDARGAGD